MAASKGLRVYLDTSVISALLDTRDLPRQELTQRFWNVLPSMRPSVSSVVLEEIDATLDSARREEMRLLVADFEVLQITSEAEELVYEYLKQQVFARSLISDARHVAIAVTSGITLLLSWNYRHLVNRARRLRVNLVNSESGYGSIEILAPAELL